MPITVSPNQNVETVVGIPVCFEGVAIYSLPQEDERCIDLPPSGPNWSFDAGGCHWQKFGGALNVLDAPASVARTIYSIQPFYIYGFNPTFNTPPSPNRVYAGFVGVLSATAGGGLDGFYGWYLFKNCGSASVANCNALHIQNNDQGWKAFVVISGTIVNPVPQGVNTNERFRVRSDGINLFWDYHHAGGWQNNIYVIPLPSSATWRFHLNASYSNNEWWDIKTFRGTFQGQIPITWTAPLGGTLTGAGNNRCFSAGTPGIYSVCLDTEFDDPTCIPVTVDSLFLTPLDFNCGQCAFVRSTVKFNSNGGFNGILTAKDAFNQPVGTVLDALTWQAPAFPVTATLRYTLGASTATCVVNVIDPLKVTNVDGNVISGLVPGDILTLKTNYPAANVAWENLTCANVVSPDGTIFIPKNPNDLCFNAQDCTIRARLLSIPGVSCPNIVNSEIEGLSYLDFRVIIDPVFPTPDFGGPNPLKWKPEVPDYRVLVNTMEGGCDETHIRNKVPVYRWTVDYTALAYDYNNPCAPIPCCDVTTGFVNGAQEQFNVAKRLDDFWNFVMGQYGYFTLIDQKTGIVWKKVRFDNKMTRDHVNWLRTQSRTVSMIWSPCCATEPKGGTCIHDSVITDNIAPNTVIGLAANVVNYHEITVTWNPGIDNVGVKGYLLEVDGVLIDVGNTLVYHHTDLTQNSSHSYRIKSYDFSNNLSPFSGFVNATTTAVDLIPPTVPLNFIGHSVNPTEIDLTWNASTDNVAVTGYIILINGFATDLGNVLFFNHTGLTSGETYSYHIRAYDAAGNKSAWSDEVLIHLNSQVKEGIDTVKDGSNFVVEG